LLENYTGEINKFEKQRIKEGTIGSVEPLLISLAKKLFIEIIFEGLKKGLKKITPKKDTDDEIINKILIQMEKNPEQKKLKFKITKTYDISKE
jgi:hypothetical protein